MFGKVFDIPFSIATPGTTNPFLIVRCDRPQGNKVSAIEFEMLSDTATNVLFKRVKGFSKVAGDPNEIIPVARRKGEIAAAKAGITAFHTAGAAGTALTAGPIYPFAANHGEQYLLHCAPYESQQKRDPESKFAITFTGIPVDNADLIVAGSRPSTFRAGVAAPADADPIFGYAVGGTAALTATALAAKMQTILGPHVLNPSSGVVTVPRSLGLHVVSGITENGDSGGAFAITDLDAIAESEWLALYLTVDATIAGTLTIDVDGRNQ